MTTTAKSHGADALDILATLRGYGAWIEPVGPAGQEPRGTRVRGQHLIEAQEHEVAPYLIASLERVDLLWLFAGRVQTSDTTTRLAQAWARALLPPDHELYAPLTDEEHSLLARYLRDGAAHAGDQTQTSENVRMPERWPAHVVSVTTLVHLEAARPQSRALLLQVEGDRWRGPPLRWECELDDPQYVRLVEAAGCADSALERYPLTVWLEKPSGYYDVVKVEPAPASRSKNGLRWVRLVP